MRIFSFTSSTSKCITTSQILNKIIKISLSLFFHKSKFFFILRIFIFHWFNDYCIDSTPNLVTIVITYRCDCYSSIQNDYFLFFSEKLIWIQCHIFHIWSVVNRYTIFILLISIPGSNCNKIISIRNFCLPVCGFTRNILGSFQAPITLFIGRKQNHICK